jgi:UTP--glucose-1-phosphate uridylyltransferase
VASAGMDDICLIICPGDESVYARAAGDWGGRLHFVEQKEARGYGHAIYCAHEFTQREPFLHLVSDHLYLSDPSKRCAQQLVELAEAEECSISAVQATRESTLPEYGAIGGKNVPNRQYLYQVETVLEKPTPTEAEQQLVVPGLRAGHYLCFFGMHVLTPAVMDILGEKLAGQAHRGVQLSEALADLAKVERYLAFELRGRRYNIGVKFGMLTTQLALALDGADREEVLSNLVELLASKSR